MAFRSIAAIGSLVFLLFVSSSQAQTLRVGMTTTDLPTTGGIPDNGSEGGRFAGYTMYDALVNWDFTKVDKSADLTPGLATEWKVDPADPQTWIFTIRQGVKFHDGSVLTADDIIWNFDRHLNDKAPNYDRAQAGSYRNYTSQVDKYWKIDDTHIALHTKVPYSVLPYMISRVFIVSPTQYRKIGNWLDFQANPSGTGPFKVEKINPHVSIDLVRNDDYWDKTRIPKLKKLILMPIPDANTRVAALRSGQVDWIEYPAPDSIPSLKAAGFQVVTKPYPHVWAWQYNTTEKSAFHDKRVRLALNYALDRDGMVELLGGTAKPSIGFYDKESKYFGKPSVIFNYDPEKAKALLKEAGYGPGGKKLDITVQLPTAGSGNMVPLPMGEVVQQNLRDVGVNLTYEVVDWGTMLSSLRQPPGAPNTPHRDGIAHGLPLGDPTNFYNEFTSMAFAPSGSNWSLYKNEKVDELSRKAFETFDPAERDRLIAEAHTIVVDDAAWLFVVHDLNPRALGKNVVGFVQAQSWYQDFTQLTVKD
ncbi:ABC transporter substrate-binding protein [Roseiarcaceae bacterium H3SJ34-1]|uniref:ABC transporter substrate-binding protein n=1 Tax=Terripilifer ovatus TaxID=3032367 RepID=UPI003AB9B09E|nr:ABC transporter substrate-binding protein [Roseiarcaceae bacterium H3SJ34-1]